MTYNEWRDELKSNLLCVPENEMLRVLDYYAEAYADRRDAGYSEREITAEFGAPYDAAQRILAENAEYPAEAICLGEKRKAQAKPKYYPEPQSRQPKNQEYQNDEVQPQPNPAQYASQNAQPKTNNRGWIFALLCVIFAIPIFSVIMTMVGVTIGFGVTPFALLIAGVGSIIEGVVELFSDITLGAATIGIGLITFGLGLILMPIIFKIVKLMWKLFTKFFLWIKSLFSGKEKQ
ncbi:MAG: hypothetical protein K2M75_00765 [Clostridia bacterium]|nr:hypothetical protein [Clostridia bacterium]